MRSIIVVGLTVLGIENASATSDYFGKPVDDHLTQRISTLFPFWTFLYSSLKPFFSSSTEAMQFQAAQIEPIAAKVSRAIRVYEEAVRDASKDLLQASPGSQGLRGLRQKLIVVTGKVVMDRGLDYAILRAKANLALAGSLKAQEVLKAGSSEAISESADKEAKKHQRELAKISRMHAGESYAVRKRLSTYNKAHQALIQKSANAGALYVQAMMDAVDDLDSIKGMDERKLLKRIAAYEEVLKELDPKKREELKKLTETLKSEQAMELQEAETIAKDFVPDASKAIVVQLPSLGEIKRKKKVEDDEEQQPQGGNREKASLDSMGFTADSNNNKSKTKSQTRDKWERLEGKIKAGDTSGKKSVNDFVDYLERMEKEVTLVESVKMPKDDGEELPDAKKLTKDFDKAFEGTQDYVKDTLKPGFEESEQAVTGLVQDELFVDDFDVSEEDFMKAYEEEWAEEDEDEEEIDSESGEGEENDNSHEDSGDNQSRVNE